MITKEQLEAAKTRSTFSEKESKKMKDDAITEYRTSLFTNTKPFCRFISKSMQVNKGSFNLMVEMLNNGHVFVPDKTLVNGLVVTLVFEKSEKEKKREEALIRKQVEIAYQAEIEEANEAYKRLEAQAQEELEAIEYQIKTLQADREYISSL